MFSLADGAKRWLFYLEFRTITTWAQLRKKFLEKYFLATRAYSIRKEIFKVKWGQRESLFEYQDQYNELCASFHYHKIPEQSLIEYLYSGFSAFDRNEINEARGGALTDKTPTKAKN